MHDMTISGARGVLTQCYTIPAKEKNIRVSFLELCIFRTNETEGDGCMFAMIGACDR